MTANLVYMTAASRGEAEQIGRTLVEERLAACVNILGPITSIYRWEGELTTDDETAFIAKTTEKLIDPLVERVRQLHSYSCPCVVAIAIQAGNPEFLNWIESETK